MNEEIELEEADIEEYAARGEVAPRAKRYRIRIDKDRYIVEKPDPTGQELLALAGKSPDNWLIYQIFRGRQPEPIDASEHVDLTVPGVERFTTVQRDPTEGFVSAMKREFALPAADQLFLDSMAREWEAVMDGANMILLVYDWKIPPGYNQGKATLALKIPHGYPDTQIDMVYFSPKLVRHDGKAIGNLTPATICGKEFQQWSRHRTAANPWRLGQDDLSTHLSLVDDWLRREFRKR